MCVALKLTQSALTYPRAKLQKCISSLCPTLPMARHWSVLRWMGALVFSHSAPGRTTHHEPALCQASVSPSRSSDSGVASIPDRQPAPWHPPKGPWPRPQQPQAKFVTAQLVSPRLCSRAGSTGGFSRPLDCVTDEHHAGFCLACRKHPILSVFRGGEAGAAVEGRPV
jgi:hypothetical protein